MTLNPRLHTVPDELIFHTIHKWLALHAGTTCYAVNDTNFFLVFSLPLFRQRFKNYYWLWSWLSALELHFCIPKIGYINVNLRIQIYMSLIIFMIDTFNDFRLTERSINDELLCKANSSKQCNSRWIWSAFDGSSAVLGDQSTVKANLSGIYRCESKCNIRGKQCAVSAMLVYIPNGKWITHKSTHYMPFMSIFQCHLFRFAT